MISVAFCTDGIFPHAVGGMQRHSRLLIEALAQTGKVTIHVIHPHKEQVFEDIDTITEIRIEGISTDNNYLKECFAYSKRVDKVLKQISCDVVYAQGLSVWHNANDYFDRLIVNPHGLEPFQAIGFKDKLIAVPFKRIFKQIFRNSRYVVSLGGQLTEILSRVADSEKLVVLPNAVNLPEIIKSDFPDLHEPVRVLFMGRFAGNKGIHVLMKAVEELNAEGYESMFQYELGGKGPLFDDYANSNLPDNVTLLGFVADDQIGDTYRNSDVFVLPTLFEGMPTVVLEAMSYGLPIIVTNVGATGELVNDDNGYLIQKNSVRELKQALKEYAGLSQEDKELLGAESLRKVRETFTWSHVAARHLEVFELISESNSQS